MASSPNLGLDSDYGSDFSPEDELLLIGLVSEAQQGVNKPADLIPTKRSSNFAVPDPLLRHASGLSHDGGVFAAIDAQCSPQTLRAAPPPRPDLIHSSLLNDHDTPITLAQKSAAFKDDELSIPPNEAQGSGVSQDLRSPLQRFRTFPRKPLSVSDLTAGAWCELQYWYTLTRLPGGRRTKTSAMRGGSKIHEKLEAEVHATVQVDVTTKEDEFALRMWNFVQGLRTLRSTGLTRELEVWGIVDGHVVNGVVDALSHENPNPDFSKELEDLNVPPNSNPNQRTLDSFLCSGGKTTEESSRRVYLTDVKTRGSLLPVSKALLRPAKIQLLLYHRFLSAIAAGQLDFSEILQRYAVKPDELLSHDFLRQMGNFGKDLLESPASTDEVCDTGEFVEFRTLREVLTVVEDEIRLTFPRGEASMGQMLRIQYVHRDDGRQIDVHDFPVSNKTLNDYLAQYMRWWHGERRAGGVDIEEAFKCRMCEFAADCSWRLEMAARRVRGARGKASTRRNARDGVHQHAAMDS